MKLNKIIIPKKAISKRKIVGRGIGSGRGKTCTYGQKGQWARSGRSKFTLGFEGGQTTLYRRLPKIGFKNVNRIDNTILSIAVIDKNFNNQDKIELKSLIAKKLISPKTKHCKILANGHSDKTFSFVNVKISRSVASKYSTN